MTRSRITAYGSYRPTAATFFAATKRTDSGCWEWSMCRVASGYGRVRTGPNTVYAHRLAWELAQGPIPHGLQVLHRCDNPPCVNPAHLFLGTNADNMADKVAKGRQHKQLDMERCSRVAADPRRVPVIARAYGVSVRTIYRWISAATLTRQEIAA